MKQSTFLQGAFIASFSFIIVKIIGVLYVIPFYGIIGDEGGALYSYGYNIYAVFLSISSAGIPFAVAKLISEYNALGYEQAKAQTFILGRNIITVVSVIAFLIMFCFATPFAKLIIGNDAVTVSVADVSFVIRCISFAVLVIPFLSISKGYLQGHKMITPISLAQIYEQAVRVLVILVGSYLAMFVLDLGLTMAVGFSMAGAFFGGLAATIYLFRKIKTNKKLLRSEVPAVKIQIENKEIIRKLIKYAIPFIITSTAVNIYLFTDMVLVVRTMGDILNYDPEVTTAISGIYSNWSVKLMMIVSAFSAGLSVSLLPNIVESYAKGEIGQISNKYNKALQMILVLIVPLTIFLSVFAEEIWLMFYGESEYGPMVFTAYIFIAIPNSLFALTNDLLQGMNKFKRIYINNGIGIGLNLVLNVPFMIAADYIFGEAFYGAIAATIFGMTWAFVVGIKHFKKNIGFEFGETKKFIIRIVLSVTIFTIVAIVLKNIEIFPVEGRWIQIPALIVYGLITFGIYGLIGLAFGSFEGLTGVRIRKPSDLKKIKIKRKK